MDIYWRFMSGEGDVKMPIFRRKFQKELVAPGCPLSLPVRWGSVLWCSCWLHGCLSTTVSLLETLQRWTSSPLAYLHSRLMHKGDKGDTLDRIDSQKNFADQFAFSETPERKHMDTSASASVSASVGFAGLAAGLDKVSLGDAGEEGLRDARPLAGATYPLAAGGANTLDPPAHSFQACDASSFSTRVGPGYAKTGAKAPAGECLYDVCGME
jgi:hypothetical protein